MKNYILNYLARLFKKCNNVKHNYELIHDNTHRVHNSRNKKYLYRCKHCEHEQIHNHRSHKKMSKRHN